jgi:hypothetical protein
MVLGRNRYANAYLALNLSIWHFACKSHVDVKRVYCRFGSILSDTTIRECLDSLTEGCCRSAHCGGRGYQER